MRSRRALPMGLLGVGVVVALPARAGDEIPGYQLCDDADPGAPTYEGEAEPPRLCDDDGMLQVQPEMGFPARRWTEARVALTGMLSWPAPVEGRGTGGLRAMWSPYLPFDAPWFQWDIVAGGYLGSWGDTRHGGVTLEIGAGARLRLPALDFATLGPMLNTTFLGSTAEGLVGFRGDVGLAADLGRIVGVELAFTSLVSEFEVEGERRYFAPGVSGSLSFDFCSLSLDACAHEPPKAALDDRTCAIYRLAQAVCQQARQDEGGAFCEAVADALDTYANPARGSDPTTAMLEHAHDRATGPAKQQLKRLLIAHRQWRHWLENGGDARRSAAKVDAALAVDRRYAPYPVELAHALGCYGATSCEDVCE